MAFRERCGLDWLWLETRHDKNHDPSAADTLACAVLCLRDGVPPGARGHRSCAYDQCTGDLAMGLVAEPVAMALTVFNSSILQFAVPA